MKHCLFLLMSVCACAQIERSSIGVMLDENGQARPVTGTPAAAALGEPVFGGAVISLACSAQICLAKTESALVSSDGETVEAPPGAALIAFAGDAAYVYFVQTRQLAFWSTGQLYPLDFAPVGDVLALRATTTGFEYAVERDDAIWIGNQNLGAANTILLLDGGGALLAADGQLRLLRSDGTELDFTVTGAGGFIGGFERMSDRYVQVITDAGMWALDIEPGREQIFLLPGGSH